MKIETERLKLRGILKEDAEALFRYRSDADTNKYQGWIPIVKEDAEIFIHKVASKINVPDTWYQLVLVCSSELKVIGDIGLHFFKDDQSSVEIGFTLSKAYHGKGYASEAVQAVLSYLFKELEKEKVIACVEANNERSISMLNRLGFQKEAVNEDGDWVFELSRR